MRTATVALQALAKLPLERERQTNLHAGHLYLDAKAFKDGEKLTQDAGIMRGMSASPENKHNELGTC
ncbi:MAG TPA: hypothetical protein DCL88_02440 [Gammaproteobacteria bacterium]|nr:hypothetical protein [Gammaproteobacteria bacterium]